MTAGEGRYETSERIIQRLLGVERELVAVTGQGVEAEAAETPPIRFRVLLDGEPPGRSHGADVDEDGYGVLDVGRMYQLVRVHDGVRDRTLQITFLDPGAEAYAFTFG